MMNNPWQGLDRLNKIRVRENIKYDVFWIIDANNQYGLMIQCDKDFTRSIRNFRLKGIDIKLDNSSIPNQLILILKEMKDWELFLVLCNDLISVIRDNDRDIIGKVMKRLERWQKLLQRTSLKVMSKEEQMGLFSELLILRDYIIPVYGWDEGIRSWVGALGDKQDFLLRKLAIEVKSYRITSGKSVWISSIEQLNSDKSPLYLFACALNEAGTGETVKELVESITEQIQTEEILNDFNHKVEQYGYIPEIQKNSLISFQLEEVGGYEVREGFPKISTENISPLIRTVNYKIDLSGCQDFKVNLTDILV
ncbi:hypothetical protein A8F94_14310 [Bacillus sp. FJAT-27225]|uniref:PD-(D/E)XK motif protein n=1 Tax=Bacillus sp. FJAT-27225 TaxID=1743144 RepID=UPI00080C3394|nr:PD-(D/E)XK motif protein [Bacillus sp. FJAT-27225]OCA86013.1 hypothetical protein A8F94_14310 [Bacillus sp. FJAT-27225]